MRNLRVFSVESGSSAESSTESVVSEPESPASCSDSGYPDVSCDGDSVSSLRRGVKQGKYRSKGHAKYSVVRCFTGSTVLLTGATGYVGALVLEQLFRTCPGITKVFLFIRNCKDRQGKVISAQERLERLLDNPEFALLQERKKEILQRTEVISADLSTPGFGLSDEQRERICRETNFIIHCAASIRFDQPIQDIMRTNYTPTRDLLRLASAMPALKCFTYMSTAYVNSNLPRGSRVREEIYPLGEESLDALEVAQTLLELPKPAAETKAKELMQQLNLSNTYFLAKTLSERLVMSFDRKPFPVCIVRPSLIGCVAGDPFPGFIGNSSGFTACILGSLAGIIRCVQHGPGNILCIVPGDVVSSATLAATMATAVSPGKLSNVVHICSSDSFPVRGKTIHTTIGAYLAEDPVVNPGQTLVRDGNYQVEFVKTRAEFRMRCLWMGVKLRTISALLKMQGRTRQARKLLMGHQMWTQLGCSKHDYNYVYDTPTTEAIYDLMPLEERSAIKPVWREDLGDSWVRYMRTYTAGVKHLFMHEPPTLTDQQDYFPYQAPMATASA